MRKRRLGIYFSRKGGIEWSVILKFLVAAAGFFFFFSIVTSWAMESNSSIWSFFGKGTFEDHVKKGDEFYAASDYSQSVKEYKSAIKASESSSDDFSKVYLKIALNYVALNKKKDAENYFDKLLEEFNTELDSKTKEKVNSVINSLSSLDEDSRTWGCCDFGSLGQHYLYGSCTDGTNCNLIPDDKFN